MSDSRPMDLSASSFKDVLAAAISGRTLSEAEATVAFDAVMDGTASAVQIAAFVAALAARGEGSAEITAGAKALRARLLPVSARGDLIDTCGTGGDGLRTLNISTAAAIVAAGAGARVAKHGNKAVSSKSGSAEVLAALGVNLDVTPETAARAIETAGVGFLMAPRHHAAMRHAAPVRAELGVRTIFNLLGPLSNPAGARFQLLGVYDAALLRPMAEVLRNLGTERAWVVHGADGLDELSISGPSHVAALEAGAIDGFEVTPEDAGLPRHPLEAIRGGDASDNARALMGLLAGQPGAYRDIVCLNAAAALLTAGIARDLADGAARAGAALDSGAAKGALERLVAVSHGMPADTVGHTDTEGRAP